MKVGNEVESCTVPCTAIDGKLAAIEKCVKSKTPQALFYWIMGGFGSVAVVFILLIGGAQWKIVDSVKEIDTNVKVMQVTVNNTQISLNTHMGKAERVLDEYEKRLDSLEHKTYRLENGVRNP